MLELKVNDLYLSEAQSICFDGEREEGEDDGAAGPIADDGPGGNPGGNSSAKKSKLFTQDEVDKLMMNHRKGLQQQVEELSAQLEATKGQDPEALMQKIQEMSLSLKTKEQQAAEREKRQAEEYESKVKASGERADRAEHALREYRITHALHAAASEGDAFSPKQVVIQLRGLTVVNDADEVKVKGLFQTEDGQPSLHDPAEAIKWMREHPEEYGNLFKSNVVGGIGGSSAPAGMPGGMGGRVDVRKLSPDEYRKLRKENPKALGFDS